MSPHIPPRAQTPPSPSRASPFVIVNEYPRYRQSHRGEERPRVRSVSPRNRRSGEPPKFASSRQHATYYNPIVEEDVLRSKVPPRTDSWRQRGGSAEPLSFPEIKF